MEEVINKLEKVTVLVERFSHITKGGECSIHQREKRKSSRADQRARERFKWEMVRTFTQGEERQEP